MEHRGTVAQRDESKRRLWLRRRNVVVALLICLGATGTGKPQEWLVETIGGRVLGGDLEVDWGGLLGDLRLDELRLYPPNGSSDFREPLIRASGIRVDYALFGNAGRSIRNVIVAQVAFHGDARDADSTNFAFLYSLLEGDDDTETSSRFLPKRVSVGSISGDFLLPDATFSVAKLSSEFEIESATEITGKIGSENLETRWSAGKIVKTNKNPQGRANINIEMTGDRGNVIFSALIPDAITASGSLGLSFADDNTTLDLSAEKLEFFGAGLAGIVSHFAKTETNFDAVRFEKFKVSAEADAAGLRDCSIEGEMTGLVVGEPGAEYYRGDLQLAIHSRADDNDDIEARILFQNGQLVTAHLAGNDETGSVRAIFEDWTKDQFVSTVPEALRASLGPVQVVGVSGNLEATWSDRVYDATARLTSAAADANSALTFLLEATGSLDEAVPAQARIVARLNDERIEATSTRLENGRYEAAAIFNEVNAAPWIRLLFPDIEEGEVSGVIDGSIHARSEAVDGPIVITPTLSIISPRFGEAELGRIEITGGARVSADFGRVEFERIQAEADDYTTRLAATNWNYDLETAGGGGAIKFGLNMGLLNQIEGLEELYGEGAGAIQIELKDGSLAAYFKFSSDYLGLGGLSVPYGSEMRGEATMNLNMETLTGSIAETYLSVGDGSRLDTSNTEFNLDPFQASGEINVVSDLQVFADMGWFQQVSGRTEENTKFKFGDDGLEAEWRVALEIEQAVLPEDAALLSDLSFEASGLYAGALDGKGTGRIGALSIAGGTAHDLEGEAILVDTTLIFDRATGRLFEGDVRALLEVGLLDAGIPISLRAEFDGVDLATLSEEVQPANTELTGTAKGTFLLDYSVDGLEGMVLDAVSEGSLSVNRSLVSDLLQSDAMLGGAGARIVDKTMAKLLGEAPQRPFDSGKLYVYLVGETIQGVAELRSVRTEAYNGLNLTVNLDMDQSALEQALKLLEGADLAELEF